MSVKLCQNLQVKLKENVLPAASKNKVIYYVWALHCHYDRFGFVLPLILKDKKFFKYVCYYMKLLSIQTFLTTDIYISVLKG